MERGGARALMRRAARDKTAFRPHGGPCLFRAAGPEKRRLSWPAP